MAVLTAALTEVKTREELQGAIDIKNREHFRKAYLEPILANGWLERTIPDKPKSRLHKYRLTPAGKEILKKAAKEIINDPGGIGRTS